MFTMRLVVLVHISVICTTAEAKRLFSPKWSSPETQIQKKAMLSHTAATYRLQEYLFSAVTHPVTFTVLEIWCVIKR